jgi:hypothetical protein
VADLSAFQAAVRNLLVGSASVTAIVPASRIVDGYAMKSIPFPRIGLFDGGAPIEHVDQGLGWARKASLGIQIEAAEDGSSTKHRTQIRTLAGAVIDALDGQGISPTGFRSTLVEVTDERPIVFFEDVGVLSKVLTVEAALQPT